MLRVIALLVGVIGLVGCAASSSRVVDSQEATTRRKVLPLERVRLYASGVGYFERQGKLESETGLPVPTGHLDDALKSLVVFNSDDTLGSVSFPSRLSPAVARARAGLPADQEAVLSYDRLLVALRGEHVELTLRVAGSASTRRVTGRVIDVVAVLPSHPSYDHGLPHRVLEEGQVSMTEQERLQMLLLSEDGRILRVDANELSAVRPLDDIVARRLHAALSARLATRSNQREMLTLRGATTNGGTVTLAYLAEAPTWRPSYRLLLEEGAAERLGSSRLQAWALVHNDTDEAWAGVRIELVDGRPYSFLFPITAPRYERRELETPQRELSSVPQLSTTTPDALWGDFSDYEGESVSRIGSDGISGVGFGGGGRGEGIGAGRTGTVGRGGGRGTGSGGGSELLWAGDLARRAGVVPTAKQTTSIYRVDQELDLSPQHSAMLPFLDAAVSATSIVWFDGLGAQAQRAVGVSNNTSNTLPAGPLSVFGRGGFLGEAMLSRLKPGGRQFARIADEPDAAIRAGRSETSQLVKHVSFRDGLLGVHAFVESKTRVWFDNQSGRTRRTYVALDTVRNARVEGCDDVDFDSTSSRAFAVFEIPAENGYERQLATLQALSEVRASTELSADDMNELIGTPTLPEAERDILRESLPLLDAWHVARKVALETQGEMSALQQDVERLQSHLKTLGNSEAEGGHTQVVQRILELEQELSLGRSRERELDKQLDARQREFEAVLAELEQFRPRILEERQKAAAGVARLPILEEIPESGGFLWRHDVIEPFDDVFAVAEDLPVRMVRFTNDPSKLKHRRRSRDGGQHRASQQPRVGLGDTRRHVFRRIRRHDRAASPIGNHDVL